MKKFDMISLEEAGKMAIEEDYTYTYYYKSEKYFHIKFCKKKSCSIVMFS